METLFRMQEKEKEKEKKRKEIDSSYIYFLFFTEIYIYLFIKIELNKKYGFRVSYEENRFYRYFFDVLFEFISIDKFAFEKVRKERHKDD